MHDLNAYFCYTLCTANYCLEVKYDYIYMITYIYSFDFRQHTLLLPDLYLCCLFKGVISHSATHCKKVLTNISYCSELVSNVTSSKSGFVVYFVREDECKFEYKFIANKLINKQT